MLWRGLVWSLNFVRGWCLKLWARFSPGHLCNSFWFSVFVLQSQTCFSLSFIKSMSWNWIHVFVHPPNRNSVQPNWKQIILPSITGVGYTCMCVWVHVVCVSVPLLLCAVYVYLRLWNSIAQGVTLSANVSYGPTAAFFFHCVWHHLPFRRINDYFILSSSQGTTVACKRAQQHTKHRLSTGNSGSKCLSPSAKRPTNISETSCLVYRCQYALTHATQHLIHANWRQVPLFWPYTKSPSEQTRC